ncbi:RcnB family protein [Caballeronia sp. DA-9]|uniref:RcnB family protein n=1 Tax=Caballeronia sp. DA-9 TaxID=3436237 RepID=UPI003F670018
MVDDWHNEGLQPPPRGYRWVGVNGDYVLAAITTGVIANIVLSPIDNARNCGLSESPTYALRTTCRIRVRAAPRLS